MYGDIMLNMEILYFHGQWDAFQNQELHLINKISEVHFQKSTNAKIGNISCEPIKIRLLNKELARTRSSQLEPIKN